MSRELNIRKQSTPSLFDRVSTLAEKAANPDIQHEKSVVQEASEIVGEGNVEQGIKAHEGPIADFFKNLNTPTQSQIEEDNKKRKAEVERQNNLQILNDKGGPLSKLKEKVGEEKAVEFLNVEKTINELNNKSIDLFDENSVNLFAPIYKIHDFLVDDNAKWGKTAQEEKNFNEAVAIRDNKIVPVIREMTNEYKSLHKSVADKYTIETEKNRRLHQQQVEDNNLRSSYEQGVGISPEMSYIPSEEERNYRTAKEHYEDVIEQMEDYTSGDAGFWAGMDTQSRDLGTLGIYGARRDLITAGIIQKQNRITKELEDNTDSKGKLKKGFIPSMKLTDSEEEVLLAIGKKQNIEQRNLPAQNKLYKLGKGVATSGVMMEQMLATAPIGGPIEAGIGKFISKEALHLTVEEALKLGGKKLAGKMLLGELVGGLTSLSAQSVISPMTYQNFATSQIGGTELVIDEKGNEKVITSQGIYSKYKKDFDAKKQIINSEIQKLSKTKSEANNVRISELQQMSEDLDKELSYIEPRSIGESAWFGYSEYMKEAFSEKFIGEVPGKVGKFINPKLQKGWVGKGLDWLGKSKLGQRVGKFNEGVGAFKNVVNNLPLGKISTEAIAYSGKMNLIDSVPGEVLEEVFTQLVPTYKSDYSKQIEELGKSEFYEDVVAQTLTMNLMFGGVGSAMKANNYRLDKKAIQDIYKKIDASVTDSELAKYINMKSTGSLYNPLEYDAMIAKLRSDDKQQEANELERTKFTNLAAHAIRTGTLTDFEKSLNNLQNKQNISEETKLNISLAQERIGKLKDIYKNYSERDNFGTIFSLGEKKIANAQHIEDLDRKIQEVKPLAKEDVDAFIARENIDVDYSIDTLFDRQFENEEEQEKYGKFLDKLQNENLVSVEQYFLGSQLRDNKQDTQNQILKKYNDQIHPNYLEKDNIRNYVANEYNSIIDNAKKESDDFQETDEFVNNTFEQLKKQYPGKEGQEIIEDYKKEKLENLELEKELEIEHKLRLSVEELESKREEKEKEIILKDEKQNVIVTDDIGKAAHEAEITNNASLLSGTMESFTPSEESVLFDPNEFDDLPTNKPLTPQQETIIKQIVTKDFDNITNLLGRQPSFREYVNHAFEILKIDKNSFKPIFQGYLQGWQLNGYQADDYNSVYNDMFDPTREDIEKGASILQQMFQQDVPAEEVAPAVELEESAQRAELEIAKREKTIVGYDEENMPVTKTAVKEIDTKRTLNILPKLAYSAMGYETIIEEGVLTKKTLGSELNIPEGSLTDFRDIINPDKNPTGTTLYIEVAPENLWSEIIVSNGRNEKGEALTTTFDKWLKQHNVDRNSKEFRDKVPAFYNDAQGKRLTFVQDTDWYNPYNVGNPFGDDSNPNLPTQEWMNHINEGKQNTSELRDNIARGLTEVTITKPSDGIFYEIPLEEPKITLQEANPQTIISIQNGENLVIGGKPFTGGKILNQNRYGDEGKFDLVNDKGERQNGNTWELRRIGLEKTATGKTIPTYRAFAIGREVTDEQIETARWAMAAHLHLRAKKQNGGGGWTNVFRDSQEGSAYAMTYDTAEKIAEDIKNNTGIDIRPLLEEPKTGDQIVQFIKLYFQDAVAGDKFFQYKNGLYKTNYKENTRQHTNDKFLTDKGLKSMVTINNLGVKSLNQKYDEYLKNTLLTNIKSFNVDTTGNNPIYATAIQPVITVSYNKIDETQKPTYIAREEAAKIVTEQLRTNNIEVKKADIEKTRQEELKAEEHRTTVSSELYKDEKGNFFKIENLADGNYKFIASDENGKTLEVIETYDKSVSFDKIYPNKLTKIRDLTFSNKIVDKINAKYDAELTTLENTPSQVPFNETKHVDFLSTLGVNADDFAPNDDMIVDTKKLSNIFNVSGDLNITQEKDVRQFIYNKIGGKVNFNYKNKVSNVAIKEDIKSEVNLYLNKIQGQINGMLTEVLSQPNSEQYSHIIDAYNTTLKNLNDIKANYDEIYNKAFTDIQKQTQLTINEKEDEDINQDDVELTVKDYNKDSIEESGKSKASYRLRRFLSEVPKYDNKGNQQTGYLGIPLYMTFNDVYNELSKTLALGSEVVSNYDAIIEKMKQSSNPFIKDVLKKLETADQQIKNELVYNFVRHTLSSKFAMYEDSTKGVSLKVYNTNANEVTRIITKNWRNNNKSSGLYNKNQSFNAAYAQSLLDEYTSWDKNDYKKVPENELRGWLAKIGLTFEDPTWKQIYTEGIFNAGKQNSFAVLYSQNAGGLFVPLKEWLTKAVANPQNYNFDGNENIFNDMAGVTKSLSTIEAKYNPSLITLSFRDSGKNISTLVPTKYVTDMVQTLKRSLSEEGNTLIDDLQALSLSENSIILDMLKNEPTFKSMFEMSHISLTAFKERGEQPYKAGITDLSDIDYDMAGITGFQDRKIDKLPKGTKFEGINMRMANMLFPTMSDKTTGLYMQTAVFDFLKDSTLDGMFEMTEDGTVVNIGPTIKTLLFNQLVLPELKRIIKFHTQVKATNIKDYDKGAMLFHFLPVMNTLKDEDGINIVKKLALTGINIDEAVEKYQPMFEEAISGIVRKEVEYKKEMWKPYTDVNAQGKTYSKMFDTKYFTEEGKNPAKDYELGVYDFVLNNLISNSEVFKVFAGDIANYSKDKQYKENGKKVNPYDIEEDQTYISINKEIGVNLGKRLALLIAPGSKLADSYGEKYNHIFLEDSIDISENSNYLIKNYYGAEGMKKAEPLLAKYQKGVNLLSRHEEGVQTLTPQRYNVVKKEMAAIRGTLAKEFPAIDAYFDIESTDAQEYSTATEHVSILHRIGRISDEEFKAITTKLLTSGTAGYLTKEELKLVFQPIKPVHTGTYVNKNQDVNRVVYIKSSSFPLVPQLTAGTKLDALRMKMEDLESKTNRFTRASYQTANKVGATIQTIKPFDVNSLEAIREYDSNDVNATVLVLDRNNFRIQQDVPFKSDKKQDDKVSMGTQFFKLLFGDGVINEENFEINGKTVSGKELYAHYNKAFADIVNSKKQELFLDLGLDQNGRATNQETFVTNLQNLLIKEASSRGYSIKSLAGLTIEKLAAAAGYYYEFKTPLWLSSDSNRYESLLNSIVTNKIMKHKMPGNGFVAGSESGFRMKESLEGIDKSRIVYLDNYNGKELQGVHTTNEEGEIKFHKAQVFIPSKFKNDKKELVDLFEGFNGKEGKYLTRRENGTLNLKPGMIDSELLNMFSFRTPTSSHKSGSTIEIAGILPPEMGDLMIVPKNFTKQKGLDYDIDKESAYQLNHLVTADGKIKVLEQSDINNITQGLRDKIAEFNLENVTASARSNFANDLFKSFVEGKGSLLDEESLTTLLLPQVDVIDKLKRVELQLGRKLAENEFIKSHLAVFNNPNTAIQNKINSVLSIDFAKDQAAKIEALNAAGEKNRIIAQYKANDPMLSDVKANEMYNADQLNFTMLTNSYQKSKMNLGAIGKVAIGVYANYSTFNALLQQHQGEQIFLQDEIGENKSIQIGHFISDGNLGSIEHVAPVGLSETKLKEWKEKHQRTIAEAFDEKINTGTDNEKEQVLGRVGVDEFTINVDALTALRGFGKDENGNSISYMLLSQPIIKELNKRRKDSKGTLGSFVKDSDLINELLGSLTDGEIQYKQIEDSLGFTAVKSVNGEWKPVDLKGEILNGNALLDGIKENGKDVEVQTQALLTYLALEEEGKSVSKLQKVINTNILGKSMIESQLKYEALAKLADNPTMKNMHLLLGEYLDVAGDRTDGYNIGKYYVVPTTPQGQIVINGLYLGNTLYQDFFPYQDESIKDVVSEILAIQGKGENLSDNTIIENFEGIVEEIKKLIYSRKKNNIFNVDPRAKRYELFKDDSNNTSLSTYMKDLVKNEDKQFRKGLRAVADNALIKTFQYETGLGENELSLIKYNNTATDNLDEEQLYNAIPELVLENSPLPNRNGQPYNTVMLAEDLAAYAFLQGGIQKATEFIKFVPVEFLESVGQYEAVKIRDKEGNIITEQQFVPANRKLQTYNTKRNSSVDLFRTVLGVKDDEMSTFTRQYFQHNPAKAPKANFKLVKNKKEQSFEYSPVDNSFPALLTLKNKKDVGDALNLYEHVGNGLYQKIDTLGAMGMSEYEYGNPRVSSIRSTSVNTTPVISGTDSLNEVAKRKLVINEKTTVKNLLTQIAKSELSPEYAHLVEAAKWLLPTVTDNQLLTMDENLDAAGRVLPGSIDVILNPNATTNISDDRTAMTFIHEVIHTVTVKELSKYFNPDFQTLRSDANIPTYVSNLMIVYNDFKKRMDPELTALNKKITDKKNNLPNIKTYTERELGVVYGAKNIKEFLTVALTSPTFQQEMNKIQYKETDMTFWDKFKSAILDVLSAIYPNIKEDSLAKASILTSMDFIKNETALRDIQTERLIPHDIQLEIEKSNAKDIKYAALDNSNEVQFTIGNDGYVQPDDMLFDENILNLPDCI